MTCLPGILSQNNQNFGWIIIIDKDIDLKIKDEIINLVKKKKRAHLYEYEEGTNLGSTEWLRPYFIKSPDYVITTNHDDDDILPENFVDSVRSHLEELEQEETLPAIKLIGARQILQWDLIHSKKAPFGWKSPWHRGYFPSSCGFSLLSKYPEANLCELGFAHSQAENYIDFSSPPKNKHIAFHRERLIKALDNCNENTKTWSKDDLFFDISRLCGPVLITNHSRNAQFERLYEKKAAREKVAGPKSFSKFAIDWEFANKDIKHFKKNYSLLIFNQFRERVKKFKRKTMRFIKCRIL